MKKVRFLKILALLFLVISTLLRILHGVNKTGLLYFAVFAGLVIYAIISALSLFPADWKQRAFEPAKEDIEARKEWEVIEDKLQLKSAFAWLNIFIMFIFSLGIYFGC